MPGFLQIHCATCQEVLDAVLIAYRLGGAQARAPAGARQSGRLYAVVHARAGDDSRTPRPCGASCRRSTRRNRVSREPPASPGGGGAGRLALLLLPLRDAPRQRRPPPAYDEIGAIRRAFGRSWPTVETYKTDDAEFVYFMVGAFATKASAAVDRLRAEGRKIGLVRPRLMRPYPLAILRKLLLGKRVAVIDQNLSLGKGGGALHRACERALRPAWGSRCLVSFVGGLGGRDIRPRSSTRWRVLQAAVTGVGYRRRGCFIHGASCGSCKKLQVIAAAERARTGRAK